MAADNLTDYEAQRLERIKKNQALVKELGIQRLDIKPEKQEPSKKRQRNDTIVLASRKSARTSTATRPQYNEDALSKSSKPQIPKPIRRGPRSGNRKSTRGALVEMETDPPIESKREPPPDIEEMQAAWSSWKPTAEAPTRDTTTGTVSFSDHEDFTPNKTPEEMLREGCFGGSYFRPLYSRSLGITISDDWKELPTSWTEGLNVKQYLISPVYNPEINKYKVQAGLPIEEWEASGWVNHTYDVRGWFQWYCRFYMGRRCEDDDRQIRRWRNCVGETGRWRLSLLRKYVKEGVKDVFDDGEDGEDGSEVSPVQHQTCHHWAFEVRQGVLDEFWQRQR